MASTAAVSLALFLTFIAIATGSPTTSTSMTSSQSPITPPQELERMIKTLRFHGYNLFANAIITSDLQYQLLSPAATDSPQSHPPSPSIATFESASSFTIFSARDTHIYDLDMAADAPAYVSTLRYHVVPNRRLILADLRNNSSYYLDTLLPHHSLLINTNNTAQNHNFLNGNNNGGDDVTVDGVRVSNPDVYVGSRIVVHGLDGILVMGFGQTDEDSDSENEKGSPHPSYAAAAAPEAAVPPEYSWSVTKMRKGSKLKKHKKQRREIDNHRRQVDHRLKDLEF